MPRLTATKVSKLPKGIAPDEGCPGLYVEVNDNFASYKVASTLRDADGKRHTIRMTLGRTSDLGLEDARDKAREILKKVRAGEDPRLKTRSEERVFTIATMYDRNEARLKAAGASAINVRNIRRNADAHLAGWMHLRLSAITPLMCADRHDELVASSGPSAARHTFKEFSAAWNHARKLVPSLPPSPTAAISYVKPKESTDGDPIPLADIADWSKSVVDSTSPLRALAHHFQLFSGLRPWACWATQREWIDLPNKCIHYPADVMKARRKFDLPLSEVMLELVERALEYGKMLYPQSPMLFIERPISRATKPWEGDAFIRGHRLRDTYATVAASVGVDDIHRMLLMDHTIAGIQGVYVGRGAMFGTLLVHQEMVSAWLAKNTSWRGVWLEVKEGQPT